MQRMISGASCPTDPRLRATVIDVECTTDEDVEWHWTATATGRFVSGYSIVPRIIGLVRHLELLEKTIVAAKEGVGHGQMADFPKGKPLPDSRNKLPRAHAEQRRYRGLR